MPQLPLSAHAIEFLTARLGSVRRLEMLIALQRSPQSWWTAAALGAELRLPVRTAADELEALAAENLLAGRIAHDVLYRVAPASDALASHVREIVEAYQADRDFLLRLVAVTGSARRFADAFRIARRPPRTHG